MKKNTFAALLGLLAITATHQGCKLQAATPPQTYTETVPYHSTWTPPPPGPGCTSIQVDVSGTATWSFTASNDTDVTSPWSLSVNHRVNVTTTSGSFTGTVESRFYSGTLSPHSSEPVYDSAIVSASWIYTTPGEIAAWSSVTPEKYLEYRSAGITIPSAVEVPGNTTFVTVTYTYADQPRCDDDDDDYHRGRRTQLPLTETFDFNIGYNHTVDAPVARAGLTNVILSIKADTHWYLYANNPTDHPTNYSLRANGGFYLTKGQTVWTGGHAQYHISALPAFTSEYVEVFGGLDVIEESFEYPLIYWPGDLHSWQQPHTLLVEPQLFTSCEGCGVYGATLYPGNNVLVTIVYQYEAQPASGGCGGDDDDGPRKPPGKKGHKKASKGRK